VVLEVRNWARAVSAQSRPTASWRHRQLMTSGAADQEGLPSGWGGWTNYARVGAALFRRWLAPTAAGGLACAGAAFVPPSRHSQLMVGTTTTTTTTSMMGDGSSSDNTMAMLLVDVREYTPDMLQNVDQRPSDGAASISTVNSSTATTTRIHSAQRRGKKRKNMI